MNPKIQQEEAISMYNLREELKNIKKRDGELSIRSAKTEEYVNQFAVLSKSDADSMEKDLVKLNIPRLKEFHIKKIIDILPHSVEEFKVVFQGYTLTISKENQESIISTVKKYSPLS